MFSIIYISSVKENFTEEIITDILETSRERNKLYNITGLLLLNEYQIIQYIEGEEKDVKQLYYNIMRDKRHTGVYTIKEETIQNRLFANWSMGYKNINNLKKEELEILNHYDFDNLDDLPLVFQKFLTLGLD